MGAATFKCVGTLLPNWNKELISGSPLLSTTKVSICSTPGSATESGTVTFAFNDSASALRIANTQQKFIPIFTFFSFIGDQDNQ